jgi:protein-disulfide isomerase
MANRMFFQGSELYTMRSKIAEYFGFVLVAAVVAMISGAGIARWASPKHVLKPAQARLLYVAAQTLIGSRGDFEGKRDSPFTLVEFMDYQCPPCKRVDKRLPGVLKQYEGRLRLTIRNCPLQMHPYAVPAAIAAEAAREQGKFWPVHDALMKEEQFQSANFEKIARAQNLDMPFFARSTASSAKDVVAADMAQAKSLNITGTPTFLLCSPQGQVIRLGSLDQIQDYIK